MFTHLSLISIYTWANNFLQFDQIFTFLDVQSARMILIEILSDEQVNVFFVGGGGFVLFFPSFWFKHMV